MEIWDFKEIYIYELYIWEWEYVDVFLSYRNELNYLGRDCRERREENLGLGILIFRR